MLLGAALFFLCRIEVRLKRRRALAALHELRSIVHVIDMHQLTKDPSAAVSVGGKTPSRPARTLARFELTRYLDYCSEMLSLRPRSPRCSHRASPTPRHGSGERYRALAAGLSQKIWQKIIILEALGPEAESVQSAAGSRKLGAELQYDERRPDRRPPTVLPWHRD